MFITIEVSEVHQVNCPQLLKNRALKIGHHPNTTRFPVTRFPLTDFSQKNRFNELINKNYLSQMNCYYLRSHPYGLRKLDESRIPRLLRINYP